MGASAWEEADQSVRLCCLVKKCEGSILTGTEKCTGPDRNLYSGPTRTPVVGFVRIRIHES